MKNDPTLHIEPQDNPVSVWSGTFTIFGIPLVCHVLSDGQRVIEAEGIHALFDGGPLPSDDPGDLHAWADWRARRITAPLKEGERQKVTR